jgi:hypothetical protein
MHSSLVLVQAKGIMPDCFKRATAGASYSDTSWLRLTNPDDCGMPVQKKKKKKKKEEK